MRLGIACRVRKGNPDGITLGKTGTWAQVEDVKGGATGKGKAGTDSREELLGFISHGREAQTSGGGRQAGLPYRWTVAPRPGKVGEREADATINRSGVYE